MRMALILGGGAALWWLAFSALTTLVVRDSLRLHRRRPNGRDVLAIISGPVFWLDCLLEGTREARQATPTRERRP